MNLQDKRELLETKQKELTEKEKSLQDLKTKVKALTIEDDDYKKLVDEVNEVVEKVTTLKADIDSINAEIETEENSLQELEEESKKKGIKKTMNYLQTKDAVKDFGKILAKGMNGADTKKAWEDNLKQKGISNPELLLPQALVTEINNAFDESGSIYSTFNDTGLTMLRVMNDVNVRETARAQGHKKGANKDEKVVTLAEREIRAQYIYKYLTLDRESIRETEDTGALVEYVLKELPQKVIFEIERAAIIGDGRAASANDKINKFVAIADEKDADGYAKTVTASANIYEDIINMKAEITATGEKYLVMSPQNYASLQLAKDAKGGYVFPMGVDIATALGVKAIFTPSFMAESTSVKAVMYVGSAYKLVGDKNLDSYENFVLSQNKNEFLMEIYKGGALGEFKSAAVLKVVSG